MGDKIRTALALMDSMIRCGEDHSDTSMQVLRDARLELDEMRVGLKTAREGALENAIRVVSKREIMSGMSAAEHIRALITSTQETE